jgi:predicted nucleic acid-binding Zn ribbon protein
MDCPYCLSPIPETDESANCLVCGAKHHAECLRENGGCAVKGCGTSARPEPLDIEVDAEPRTLLVLSRESVEQARSAGPRRNSNPCIKCGKQLPEGELYCLDCSPEINENQDVRNVGPLLVMIAVIALAVGWMVITTLSSPSRTSTPSTAQGTRQSSPTGRQ